MNDNAHPVAKILACIAMITLLFAGILWAM